MSFLSEYKIKGIITADRFGDTLEDVMGGKISPEAGVNVSNGILELNLFESITSPFINGTILIGDTDGYLENLKLNGTEYIELTIEIKSKDIVKSYRRVMMIREVSQTIKGNDAVEIKQCELIDPFAYFSRCHEISRFYKGPPIDIIRKILSDRPLNKVVDERYSNSPIQSNMQIVTPWWEPLKIVEWVRDRCTNINGFPYMVYSNIFQDEVIIDNLENMLNDINKQIITKPFVYSHLVSKNVDERSHYTISALSRPEGDNTLNLVSSGAVGSYFSSFDMSRGREVYGRHHDITKTLFSSINGSEINIDRIASSGSLTQIESNAEKSQLVDNDFNIDGQLLKNINSRRYYQIGNTGTFDDAPGYRDESNDDNLYKSMIQNKAIRNALYKHSMQLELPGSPFMINEGSTVGSRIQVEISSPNGSRDETLSGRYTVVNMRHIFRNNTHNVAAEVTRLETR